MENEHRNITPEDLDEQEQRPPELDGQLSFDGTEYHEQRKELTDEGKALDDAMADLEAAGNELIKATRGGTDEDIEQATKKYNDLWARVLLTEDRDTFLLFYAQLLLNNPICGTPEEIKEKLKIINDHLTEAQRKEFKEKADEIKGLYVNAGKLQARAEIVKSFLLKELQKDEYNGETLNSLLYDRDAAALADPEDKKTKLLIQALEMAELMAKPSIKSNVLTVPLDKVNSDLWNIAPGKNRVKLTFQTTPHNLPNAAPVHITGLLLFDESIEKSFNMTKKLTPFDRRIQCAIEEIWKVNHDPAGRVMTTLTEIYYNMGNTGRPNSTQLKKIYDSMLKQDLTRITLDNQEEAENYNYKYYHKAGAALLEMRENIQLERNGKITDGAILIQDEPPLMNFARLHNNQITDIPMKVLQSPISKTENNLGIEHYLQKRIAPIRNEIRKLKQEQEKKYTLDRQHKINEKAEFTILLSTLYENTGHDTTRQEKKRARDIAMKYLNYYKSEKAGAWIKDAKLSKDNTKIIITLPK